MQRRGEYRQRSLRFKTVVFFWLRRGIRSDKIGVRTRIPQSESLKHQGRKQSSVNLADLPNSGRTFGLSFGALKPNIRDRRRDGPFLSEIWERNFFFRGDLGYCICFKSFCKRPQDYLIILLTVHIILI